MTPTEQVVIHVVADSTGDTGARVARAVQSQYPGLDVAVVRHPRLHSQEGLDDVVEQLRADPAPAVVYCTVVDETLHQQVLDRCAELGIPCADLLTPALDAVAERTGATPTRLVQPVGLAADYFERIHAMEFAIANDDGNATPEGLAEAQIVLVGASRTGKTPLSMYLGYLGYRTANIPLVAGVAPPSVLGSIDRWKIVGLTIDPERLLTIRRRRVDLMGAGRQDGGRLGGYADLARILEELDDIAATQRRLGCPVLDTTSLALEEAAGRIIDLVTARRRANTVLSEHVDGRSTPTSPGAETEARKP
ncbi:pyruvate, water dikinase regulatory protein [Isoptericola chiayiensis]|uniref:Putative pyruvate, phosphate dikinase regulatory protein n=1 Tax=Isoptericola chiayiensis TaxID=579446 RepID=A0ABP8Y4P9_9MICO|nr:pyruvate, water dikinase regulatory protein [Isoptericola chiayiensis]NOV99421.1 hypothetical protein [Isoptericola chiayiensis]